MTFSCKKGRYRLKSRKDFAAGQWVSMGKGEMHYSISILGSFYVWTRQPLFGDAFIGDELRLG